MGLTKVLAGGCHLEPGGLSRPRHLQPLVDHPLQIGPISISAAHYDRYSKPHGSYPDHDSSVDSGPRTIGSGPARRLRAASPVRRTSRPRLALHDLPSVARPGSTLLPRSARGAS